MKNKIINMNICKSTSGFTLVELIVVMAIFIVAIMLSSDAFNRISLISRQQVRSSESNIQGIIGLELFRSDIEHAGYGLPWQVGFVADFAESNVAVDFLAKGVDPAIFNDTANISDDTSKVPRAVQSAKASSTVPDPSVDGRDYLVIKSTAIGMGAVSKKWSFVEGLGSASYVKKWNDPTVTDLATGERVIIIDSRTRRLIGTSLSNFSFALPGELGGGFPLSTFTDFQPTQDTQVFVAYGVTPSTNLRAPYNRADYYIRRPADISSRCAPGTGNLYKAVLIHNGGGVTQYPLLECVADMQVVYGLDSDGDGGIDAVGNEDLLSALSAKNIRDQLKQIRVYLLVHEGQKDSSYYQASQTIEVGDSGFGRVFDLSTLKDIGNDWRNYRWKVYRIVVTPKNLLY